MNPKPPPASPATGGNSTALDQWRGLALVFVLISHGFYFSGHVHGIGRVGVNLFFFISGVLVFKSLTGHHDRTPWARTKHFWGRRLRRLYPALVAYVLGMLPIAYLLRDVPGAISASMHQYLQGAPVALFYGTNYLTENGAMSLGHLWSVSCEMQFYLLAPAIYWLGGQTKRRRNLVWGVLLAILLAVGFVGGVRSTDSGFKYHFEIAVWPMMLGFCCEYRKDWFQRIPAKWFHGIIVASIVAFGAITLLMFCGLEMKVPVIAIGSLAFIPCFSAYLGNRVLEGPVGRLMTWLGERTYSIYLWQQPLTICNYLPTRLHPAGAVLSTLIGGLWFHWFERPFLSTKRQQVTSAQKFPRNRKYRWLWIIVSAALLGGAIAAVFIARHRYAETLAAKVWPTQAFALPDLQTAGVRGGILLLGDSRIADWGRPALGARPSLNAGFRGITSAELAMVTPEILRQTQPDVVVIEVGINDLKLLGVRPGWRDKVVDECVSNIVAIMNDARASGAYVIVNPVWPPGKVGWWRRLAWSDAVGPAVDETNVRLERALTGQANVVVDDPLSKILGADGSSGSFDLYADTLHLRPEAYAKLSGALAKKVQGINAGAGR